MSLISIANELEFVPQDQLVEFMNNPNSRYPQYLVLSEIQRRTQLKKMYENQTAKMNSPETTVAEEAVMEFANQGAMSSMPGISSSPSPDTGLSSMAPPSPQIGMASGGITKFANGGSTSTQRNLLISLGTDPEIVNQMSDEQIISLYKTFDTAFPNPANPFSVASAIDFAKENPFQTALGVASINPMLRTARFGLQGLYNYGKPLVTKSADVVSKSPVGTYLSGLVSSGGRSLYRSPGYTTNFAGLSDDAAYKALATKFPGLGPVDPTRISLFASTALFPPAVSEILSDDESTQKAEEETPKTDIEKRITDQNPEGDNNRINAAANFSGLQSLLKNIPKVEVPEFTEEDKQRELDVYALGALAEALGGSKNLGEAGVKLGAAAIGLPAVKEQQRKRSLEAASAQRAQAIEEFGLQESINKLEIMSAQAINSRDSNLLGIVQSLGKLLQEVVSEEERNEIINQIEQVYEQLGFAPIKQFTPPK